MKQQMAIQVSSEEQQWITPPEIIEDIKKVLGEIDLDPASSKKANQIVGANRIFTIEDDALTQNWECKTCFMNPPYGKVGAKSQAGIFADYMIDEFNKGNIEQEGMILLHSRFGYSWFNDLMNKLPSCTLWNRVRFINPDTMEQGAQAKTSQTIFFLSTDNGHSLDNFVDVFQNKGMIYIP